MIIIIYHHNLRMNVVMVIDPRCTNVDRIGTSGCNKAFWTAYFYSMAFSGCRVQCSEVTQRPAAFRNKDRQQALAPCSGPTENGKLLRWSHRCDSPPAQPSFQNYFLTAGG